MRKAIFSRIDLEGKSVLALQYQESVSDIINHHKVEELAGHTQHFNTCRLQHSLNVSYYSFVVCRKLGWDKHSAARAGLMHDLYYYNWRDKETKRDTYHAKYHPMVARENAKEICDLNHRENDAIINHMWPLTITPPKYKESYVVCMVDKACAMAEFMCGVKSKFAF